MEMEKQVVRKELAKQMKELGAKQNSIFYWLTNDYFKDNKIKCYNQIPYPLQAMETVYSAYTVAELGEMLPRGHWESGAVALDTLFFCSWEEDWEHPNEETSIVKYGNTEADARAKMWIHLKKEKAGVK